MSQKDDSENDIWEYRPLEKKKKTQKSQAPVTKRRCASRKASRRDAASSAEAPGRSEKVKTAENGDVNVSGRGSPETHTLPPESPAARGTVRTDGAAEGPSSGDFCPMCQMPFSILVVQSQRWHVAECMDTSRDKCQECPDGLLCSSTIPNHYKKFNHTLLAHSRANSDAALLSLSQQAETSGDASPTCLPGLISNEVDGSALETSQDSAVRRLSASSPCSINTGTPPSKLRNGLMFLRSPGPEDFKKKKGWASSAKAHKSTSASQENKTELSSTPVKEKSGEQGCEGFLKREPSPEKDDAISYSPLSEFPAETEVSNGECRKALFGSDAFHNDGEDSMVLFGDGFSSEDELLSQFIDDFETSVAPVKDPSFCNSQLSSVTSLAPTNQLEKDAHSRPTCAISPCKTSSQSPQSIVLERLRETLLSSDSLQFKHLTDSIQSEQPHTSSHRVPSSQTMPPQRGQSKAGQAAGLKQTDIGVFFGLKPLKVKEEEEKVAEKGSNEVGATSPPTPGESSGRRRPRRDRQRKSKADPAADTSLGTVAADGGDVASARGAARGGRSRGWRRGGWNRGNADGEVQLRRCPFYKKIPGTKFVVDAFQYGEIEGITAYFLTHFHSDHYGGLTKKFTFPIYCNRITGNLVKSKLKVAEQYVHILPMNTQVTVEGVGVILLDANHCPGAAMLLLLLPDGQTVLHTGDFRADPSMEVYPELVSCRVQTLYLDTTYCSPEYTFPRQQEVISFAASTAFELVTLNPRTLVVCGSYSVGKEKVFLALAEVLGSKVCLSRDKYNTMCCLESEQVRQRITTDWKAAQVHVLPMMQLSVKKLQDHLARFSGRYDQLVAFKPTGWTFSQQVESVEDIQPQISGSVSIYGIPYSEHSSFLELKRFVQWIQPLKIIPTVNNGTLASRKTMDKYFSEWLMETRAKR